jgi:hypothetical protein
MAKNYADLLKEEGGRTKKVTDFEEEHKNTPGAAVLFESVLAFQAAKRRTQFWKWTTRTLWTLCVITAAWIAGLAYFRADEAQKAQKEANEVGEKLKSTEAQLSTAEKKSKETEVKLAELTKQLDDPSGSGVLVASLSIRPDHELGGNSEVTVDDKGVFHAKDLVALRVTSPRDGFATLLWLDPKNSRIFPEPAAARSPKGEHQWKVQAGKAVPFDAPLPTARSQFLILVVITPDPTTALIRKAIDLKDVSLLGDADRLEKNLREALLRDGRRWVGFAKVTLAPQTGKK